MDKWTKPLLNALKNIRKVFRLVCSAKSAIAQHALGNRDRILFDNITVLDHISHYIKEAIEIKFERNNFNRDSGLMLSNAWATATHHFMGQDSRTGRVSV